MGLIDLWYQIHTTCDDGQSRDYLTQRWFPHGIYYPLDNVYRSLSKGLYHGKHGILDMEDGPIIVTILFEYRYQFQHESVVLGLGHNKPMFDKILVDVPDTLDTVQIIDQDIVQTISEKCDTRLVPGALVEFDHFLDNDIAHSIEVVRGEFFHGINQRE
jgi:hypothetical protein